MIQQPTLFMRIHKTAGEALAKQIHDRLAPDTVCPIKFDCHIRELPAAELRRFRFFEGHITPPSLSTLFPNLRAFTMLREPRERLLSCYFYWKEGSRHARGTFFDALANLSLPEFLNSDEPVIRRATWNVQARLLANGQFGGVDGQRQTVFGPWLNERELATEALRALDRFAFVGLTEHYGQALQAAFSLLELGPPPPPERINVTAGKPSSWNDLLLVPDIDRALRRLTEADQVVYDTIRARIPNAPPAAPAIV